MNVSTSTLAESSGVNKFLGELNVLGTGVSVILRDASRIVGVH